MPARTDIDVEQAAIVAAAGLDVNRYLNSDDPLEQALMVSVADRVLEIRADDRQDLARRIRDEIMEGLSG